MPEVCNVCVTSRRLTVKAFVECPGCAYRACGECYKTWICNVKKDYPVRCMNCSLVFTFAFVRSAFKKAFFEQDLKQVISESLFQNESKLFFAAAPYCEARKMQKRINVSRSCVLEGLILEEQKLKAVNNAIAKMKANHHPAQEIYNEYLKHDELRNDILHLKQAEADMNFKLSLYDFSYVRQKLFKSAISVQSACSEIDCRGSYDESGRCCVCATCFCTACHQKLDESHVCDSTVLETIKAVNETSKRCPTCTTPISKIEGCDMMYCVVCKEKFNWISGRRYDGDAFFHNPQYALEEARALMPLRLTDMPCGGFVTQYDMWHAMTYWKEKQIDTLSMFFSLNVEANRMALLENYKKMLLTLKGPNFQRGLSNLYNTEDGLFIIVKEMMNTLTTFIYENTVVLGEAIAIYLEKKQREYSGHQDKLLTFRIFYLCNDYSKQEYIENLYWSFYHKNESWEECEEAYALLHCLQEIAQRLIDEASEFESFIGLCHELEQLLTLFDIKKYSGRKLRRRRNF